MNERIKELKQQATIEHPIGHGIVKYEFSPELFAELIVQECQFAIVSRTDLPKHERKLYNNVLKEYFGVDK